MIHLVLTRCEHTTRLVITTTEREHYALDYCPERCPKMAKSTAKTILFATVKHAGKTHQLPVAVFNDSDKTRAYATFVKLATRAKDAAALVALIPAIPKGEDGVPAYDVKLSMVQVPYEPSPELDSDELTDNTPATT